MLSTPVICCSTGVATDCSTVNASAPMYWAINWTSGGAILGNCETGSWTMAMTPMITVTIEMTIATMGRLMKNLDIGLRRSGPWRCEFRFGGHWKRSRVHDHSCLHSEDSFDDDPLARFEPLVNDPHRVHAVSGFDRANIYLFIRAHDGHLIGALQLRHRPLGNEQRAFLHLGNRPNAGVQTRTKNICWIRE